MRAFNQANNSSSSTGTGRRTSSCSYCNDTEHQVTSCPHVKSDWAMFQLFEIPCVDPANWTNNPKPPEPTQSQYWNNQQSTARYYKDPSGWSKWYAECEKALGKIQAKELRDAQKANAKSSGKKAKSCGFCGGTGHNRRDCSEMTALNERIIKANAHWRQRLYTHMVENLGLCEGALVKVNQETGSWLNRKVEQKIGLVTSINWSELNMFCYTEKNGRNWRTSIHENLQAPMVVKVHIEGKDHTILWPSPPNRNAGLMCDAQGEPLVDVFPYNYNAPTFESVVSPSETPLSAEWLTQGQAECVEFITKRYSLDKLTKWNAISLLESYEQKWGL
jgi:hypothetical protein